MNKILAIALPVFYLLFVGFNEQEFAWVFRILTSLTIGSSIYYLWTIKSD